MGCLLGFQCWAFSRLITQHAYVAGFAAVMFLCAGLLVVSRRSTTSNLPGPPGYPIIGNLHQIILAKSHAQLFANWKKAYGDLVYFSLFGKDNIIINSASVARELLDKRGSIYSDRPDMVMFKLIGWGDTLLPMPYGERFRKHRRLMRPVSTAAGCKMYDEIQTQSARKLLMSLIRQPECPNDHFSMYAASTIFKIAYGINIKSPDDEILKLAQDSSIRTYHAYQIKGSIVDLFPVFRLWPSIRRTVDELRRIVNAAHAVPYNTTKEQVKSGTAGPSLVADAFTSFGGVQNISGEDDIDIQGFAGLLFLASNHTTTGLLESYLLAMVLFPGALRKAQDEIDAVVGNGRLPGFEDREQLPYLEAMVKELYRWSSVATNTFPHLVTEDNVYEGRVIRRGTLVMVNLYNMLSACPRTEVFDPMRFVDRKDLGDVPEDPRDIAFGFGRRRCPGMYFGDRVIWLAVAQMSALLNISPEVVDGEERPPPLEFLDDVSRHPKPFKCSISVREGYSNLVSDWE